MKIGIVSDSHGHDETLRRAVDLLVERGAEAIVHCGDVGAEACIDVLAASGRPTYVVSGNTDRAIPHLIDLAAAAGIEFHWEVIEVPLGNGQFLVATHGHDPELVSELVAGQQFPYVCVGHSHRVRDERRGRTRIINPGALHRAVPHTAALLDTASDRLEFLEVE